MRKLFLSTAVLTVYAGVATSVFAQQASHISASDLLTPVSAYALAENRAFVPASDAAKALSSFQGTLALAEGQIFTDPAEFKKDTVLGKNPQVFPGVTLSFVTDGDDLLPTNQNVIRSGTLPTGKSFWDIIVQNGKVWSEAGDDGWSRASFPFSLVNSIEGETHNGVAMFLYKDGQVSNLRYQIVQQTAPFYIEDYFTASGSVSLTLDATKPADADQVIATARAAKAQEETIGTWDQLGAKVGADKLAGFDNSIRPAELVLDGLMVEDKFYLKSCPTVAGELPYCSQQRFGVWSVTKSASTAAAMLSIAEKYGPEIFDQKLVDLVPAAKDIAGWDKVKLGDLLNMASGMGYGKPEAEPASIFEPFGDAYYAWYEARTSAEKVDILLKAAKPYPWGPGKVARYRDEDFFLLGVALTNYLKTKEGPDANVWTYLIREVYQPIGILQAPTNKTIEAKTSDDQPLMAYGFYPSLSDIIKLARLYQNDGKYGDRQILNVKKLSELKTSSTSVGLATGVAQKPNYQMGFWRVAYAAGDCKVQFPTMDGWGENYVMLMPGKMTAVRLAKNFDGDASAGQLESMSAVAARIRPFCN